MTDAELREGMAAHLAAHPGLRLSVHELGRVLGFPKGHNARILRELAALESAGVVVRSEEQFAPDDGRRVTRWQVKLCGATDGFGLEDELFGRCQLPAGHDGDWHLEERDGEVWASWRGPHPGQRCGICGRDGSEH